MKTLLHLASCLAVLLPNSMAEEKKPETEKNNPPRVLIAYYSRSNNTRKIAEFIQTSTGAQVFEIIPAKPYPEDYTETTEQAKKEIREGYKPELKNKFDKWDDYDVIYLGSPCWWATMAPPVATFLSSHDFAGKTIIPFMTHEGSGLGRYVSDIRKLAPKAKVLEGKAFRGKQVSEAKEEVSAWVLKNTQDK